MTTRRPGKIDYDTAKKIAAGLKKIDRMYGQWLAFRSTTQVVEDTPSSAGFFAQLLSATAQAGTARIYDYGFQEVEYDGVSRWSQKLGGITGTAINLLEANTPDCGVAASGVDNSSPNYPDGFDTLPIGKSGEHQTIVRMFAASSTTGSTFYWFEAIPSDFGPCTGARVCP